MTTRQQIARGAFWTTLEFAGGEAASFVVFIVLARLVAPADFGLIALGGVVVVFVQIFLTQGFAEAIIQKEHVEREHLDAAFWANLAIAAVFALLVLVCAGGIARICHAPELAPVLRAMTLLFPCAAMAGFFHGIFKRRLEFQSLALRALVGVTCGGIVGIALAALGAGVWALVAQQLANNLVSVTVLWWRAGWTPRWHVSRPHLDEMLRFGAKVAGSGLIGFVQRRGDVLLLGLFRPPEEVGYYYLAQRLLLTAGLVTYSTLQAVALPVLSRLQASPERFRAAVALTLRFAGAITVPVLGGLGLVAGPAIEGILGPRWAPAVPALQILGLYGAMQALSDLSGPILIARGRPGAFLRLSLLQAGVFLVAFLASAPYGIVALAGATVAAQAIVLPFHLAFLERTVGLSPASALRSQAAPWLAGAAMAASVVAIGAAVPASPLPRLAAMVAAGAAVYLGVLWIAAPSLVRRVVDAILDRDAGDLTRPEPAPAAATEGLPSARDAA